MELDIYIPKLNIAIEFNGVYWHSEVFKNKDYHINKTKICKSSGIELLHIWEDDWKNKRPIIESMILNKIGITPNKIWARNCEIREINDVKISREFLNENHIQGYSNSKFKIGLYHKNELISIMTFSKKRKNMELVRFCSKLNTNVVGGSSRLFKYFIRKYNYDNVISYSDISFFSGGMYEKLGFTLDGSTPPNYWWVVDYTRKHRFNFNKKKS